MQVLEYLKKSGIKYESRQHKPVFSAQQMAAVEHEPGKFVVKPVVVKVDGKFMMCVLAACYKALKPGGILGVEDHRGRTDKPQDPKAASGYVREDYAIALARKAGFEFVGSSEINANPKDTKDWVDGVWTLPPTLSQGEKDRSWFLWM